MLMKTRPQSVVYISVFLVFLVPFSFTHAQVDPSFTSYEISNWGDKMGQTSVVDMDGDGDLDWVVGRRDGAVSWFEYQGPNNWTRRTIGNNADSDVGGTAFDVDGDGDIDQVSGNILYLNNGSNSFTRHNVGTLRSHDTVAADMDGDGILDIVAMTDATSNGLRWYKRPNNVANITNNWQQTIIGPGVHGGIDPLGVGDIDGDGDNDVVRSTGWFENQNNGATWVPHLTSGGSDLINGGNGGQYPDTTKSWIIDMDGDGDNDIVMASADSESGTGWVRWFRNLNGNGLSWETISVAENQDDMHSLIVADFDNDGDVDIFSGDGPNTGENNNNKQSYIWRNNNGIGTSWTSFQITSGYEVHEAKAGDVDGDGDLDILFKPWNIDGGPHVYLGKQSRPRNWK